MKEVKNLLYLLAIVLFLSNYQICDYFYYNDEIKDLKKWWGLRSNITATIIMLVFYASLINTKGVTRLILSICVGLCVSNVIDKVFFNVLYFNYKDIIMIILTICIATYNYLNNYERPYQ
tara:strand:- start:373 stop:732 length:360 start_codon:yes stop_codon:yes gene_type:complete